MGRPPAIKKGREKADGREIEIDGLWFDEKEGEAERGTSKKPTKDLLDKFGKPQPFLYTL